MGQRKPKRDVANSPTGTRNPRVNENPNRFYEKNPTWSFKRCDFDHETWGIANNTDKITDVLKRFKDWEGQRWIDIFQTTSGRKHTQHHSIPINELVRAAQERIKTLQLMEYDELYSMSIAGRCRLWGVITEGVFHVIWIDPNHEICPSHKSHT